MRTWWRGIEGVRLRRRAGSPIVPHMDEVYVDLCLVTELVLLLTQDPQRWKDAGRVGELRAQLRDRLEAQKREIDHGPPPA